MEQTNSTVSACCGDLLSRIDEKTRHEDELRVELKKMKASLSTVTKERDILKLKTKELQQKNGILESAQKARFNLTPKKRDGGESKTNSSLKKLGLTEDILLSLPFGYASKVRSSFEKLSYENDKLRETLSQVQGYKGVNQSKRTVGQELLDKFDRLTKEKDELVKKLEIISAEKNLTVETLNIARSEAELCTDVNEALRWLFARVELYETVNPK